LYKRPQAFVTKAYIFRKLNELDQAAKLAKRAFRSLQEAVLISINSETPLVLGSKLQRYEETGEVGLFKAFIEETSTQIKEGIFAPAKYTDPRGSRWFLLLPIHDYVPKNVTIDSLFYIDY
jgi:hypothetical protein